MLFTELKQKSHMTLTQLSQYFGVPYRTVQNWAAGVSQCPEYLMKLFVYKLEHEGRLFPSQPTPMCEEDVALRLKVEITGDMNDYAKAFLAIYNNVKSDKDLHKMYNDYGNGIYLVCTPEVGDAAKEFLSQFGDVTRIEQVKLMTPYVECYDYPDDVDVEWKEYQE
jgi:hypothetical protein